MKMENFFKIVLMVLKLSSISALPLQFPLLQPLPGTVQQQQLALQEQMLAIQQFHAMQRFNALPSPLALNMQQPLLLLLPNMPTTKKDERYTNVHENNIRKNPVNNFEDDSDAITIDAEPEEVISDSKLEDNFGDTKPMRAVLLVPNTARFSIGGIISSIPFLPIEINVPDSISWIYEGISGIISGIGQRWPFNRPQTSENNENVKSNFNDLKTNKIMPIVVMPLGQPMLPLQG